MGKERSFVVTYARRYLYSVYVIKGERKVRYVKTSGKWNYEEYVIVAMDEDQARDIFDDEVVNLPFSLPPRIKRDIEDGNGCVETDLKDVNLREDI